MIQKRLSKLTLQFLGLLSALILFTSTASAIELITKVVTPKIELSGLANYVGKVMTVYYALGTRASLSTDEAQLHLRSIKSKQSFLIENEKLEVPSLELERVGIQSAYNLVVFVVHESGTEFAWFNANGSQPTGETLNGTSFALGISSLLSRQVDQTLRAQSDRTRITYVFGDQEPKLITP